MTIYQQELMRKLPDYDCTGDYNEDEETLGFSYNGIKIGWMKKDGSVCGEVEEVPIESKSPKYGRFQASVAQTLKMEFQRYCKADVCFSTSCRSVRPRSKSKQEKERWVANAPTSRSHRTAMPIVWAFSAVLHSKFQGGLLMRYSSNRWVAIRINAKFTPI